MSFDPSRRRVILIHGLASKPPAAQLHALWTRCLVENLRVDDPALAGALEEHPEVFQSAYWADAVPHHIPDDAAYVGRLRLQVEKVITARRRAKDRFHVGTGEKVAAFFRNRGADLAKVLAGALTVKDDVMKRYLEEVRLYADDQHVADRIREPLEAVLRRTWEEGREVAVLSHSMGTFIAYDVLWRFSHRDVAGFREYRRERVGMLVTMGSPLGERAVRDLLFARHHRRKGKREFPTSVDLWHNYACMGDVVSHDATLEDDLFEPMRAAGALPRRPAWRAIDYRNLHNPFEVVAHRGNRGRERRNPHKSYGYLVQPRLGTWLADFLHGRVR